MAAQRDQESPIGRQEAMLITRREAVQRVTALLGGMALVGGGGLLAGCRPDRVVTDETVEFSREEIAFLDEIAETILPETRTPGAKAAQTGAFMALVVRDVYDPDDQRVFRDGMRRVDDESRRMHNVAFMEATPQQRLTLLEHLDREQKAFMDARAEAQRTRSALDPPRTTDTTEAGGYLPDQRQEGSLEGDASPVPALTADAPAHYFRMMKELALLGYFTSEIGYTQAMRWQETPGRFDPCVPYTPGDRAWAPHA
jgi:hypothetical protein